MTQCMEINNKINMEGLEGNKEELGGPEWSREVTLQDRGINTD